MEIDLSGILEKILHICLHDKVKEIFPIRDFGTVNAVYDIHGEKDDYIIRLNEQEKARFEFPKERWCLEKAREAGIPSPRVLDWGTMETCSYMVLTKIHGVNGSLLKRADQLNIWKQLGAFVRRLSRVKSSGFGDKIVDYDTGIFADSWEGHLSYNLEALHPGDPLLVQQIISEKEQRYIRQVLLSLKGRALPFGLVHGDLSCRNVIAADDQIYLLDWGLAERHVYPHTEIGILLKDPNTEWDEEKRRMFLTGLDFSADEMQKWMPLIKQLHLLKRLDKFRWAYDQQIDNIDDYSNRLRNALEQL